MGFTSSDIERVRIETLAEYVEYHPEIESTNDRALLCAREAVERPYPCLILADRQTAGRGRGSNQWWAAPGALTFSLALETTATALVQRHWPLVSLTVGLAVCEALERYAPESCLHLKWPNDVYMERRKVCGILLEAPPAASGVIVIGVGVNINNSLQDAPPELQTTATSLRDVMGTSVALVDVLISVLRMLDERLAWIGSRHGDLLALWRQRCLLSGREIEIDTGQRTIRGLCEGIDEDGALVLQTDEARERCFAGVVTHF